MTKLMATAALWVNEIWMQWMPRMSTILSKEFMQSDDKSKWKKTDENRLEKF